MVYISVRVALATISNFLPENDKQNPGLGDVKDSKTRQAELRDIRDQAQKRPFVWDTERILTSSTPSSPRNGEEELSTHQRSHELLGIRDQQGNIVPIPSSLSPTPIPDAHHDEKMVKILEKKSEMGQDSQSEIPQTGSSVLEGTQIDQQSQSSAPNSTIIQGTIHRVPAQADSMDVDIPTLDLINQADVLGLREFVDSTNEKIPSASGGQNLDQSMVAGDTNISPERAKQAHGSKSNNIRSQIVAPQFPANDSIETYSPSRSARPALESCASLTPVSDPIEETIPETFSKGSDQIHTSEKSSNQVRPMIKTHTGHDPIPSGPETVGVCECKDWHDDIAMIVCESCLRWRHLSCYGYKSLQDPRIPSVFICFRCRIHDGLNLEEMWEKEDEIKSALEGLRTLCIFRRALQIIYVGFFFDKYRLLCNGSGYSS